jgi:signal transduction histidine kinase
MDTEEEIEVHMELADNLFAIQADQRQIAQILQNLLANALDAMPRGGDLYLKTANVTHADMKGKPYQPKSGNYVLLTVTDTGIGMDQKTLERIFEPFFSTKGIGKGLGLGLASVYGIVKAQGGYIDVYSKKGHGTTFQIYLPAVKNEKSKENFSVLLGLKDKRQSVPTRGKERNTETAVSIINGNDALNRGAPYPQS